MKDAPEVPVTYGYEWNFKVTIENGVVIPIVEEEEKSLAVG